MIFLCWHLGLGDALICNGLVRVLVERFGTVFVPAKHHNVASVSFMFSDLPQVKVVAVENEKEMMMLSQNRKSVRLGLHSREGLRRNNWDKQFYEQAGMDFEYRWSRFRFPEPKDPIIPETTSGKWCFVHDDPLRGFGIDFQKLPVDADLVRPKPSGTIFDWAPALTKAFEIHCIDSCFAILADSIPCRAEHYVLHLYARNDNRPNYHKDWIILK